MTTDYMNPGLQANLKTIQVPLVRATPESMAGYGHIVIDPSATKIQIVRWPAKGWRPVDEDSGDEAGTTEGVFTSCWDGDVLLGKNEAVGGEYILGYSVDPSVAERGHMRKPKRILMWHANYHPDGGQMFFPIDDRPYLVPLALPGDDVNPEDFKFFLFKGSEGCYIHPDIWHDGVFTIDGQQRFFDRQGRVHARVSVDFAREFDCLVEVNLEDSLDLQSCLSPKL